MEKDSKNRRELLCSYKAGIKDEVGGGENWLENIPLIQLNEGLRGGGEVVLA